MAHRYKVGQVLELRSAPQHSSRPAGPCKVLVCLPHDRGPVQYRVQSSNEQIERVVDEADLSPSATIESPVRLKAESYFSGIPVGRR